MLEHGGNLLAAAARFGRAPADWIDLSTGINPQSYPAPAFSQGAWHRLPETDPELLRAATSYYGAPQLLAVAGTQAAIQMLPRLRPPSRVVVASPSYAEHAHHWGLHGHAMRQVAYHELEAALPTCEVMVLCNPNNPTGATVAPEKLLDWALQLAGRGGWLVVDEAFGDITPNASVAGWSDRPGLIVLRSIGKFFGLAGARVGFVGAHPELLSTLRSALGPWPISGPAQQISRSALDDTEWQSYTRRELVDQGKRLHALLGKHAIVARGTALFQWWPERRAEQFWEHMAQRGIWVRLFPHAARGIRLGLPGNEAAWRRLETALDEWKKK